MKWFSYYSIFYTKDTIVIAQNFVSRNLDGLLSKTFWQKNNGGLAGLHSKSDRIEVLADKTSAKPTIPKVLGYTILMTIINLTSCRDFIRSSIILTISGICVSNTIANASKCGKSQKKKLKIYCTCDFSSLIILTHN